ncbi:MAG: hypothetical protein ACK2UJ_17965 [Candidatus Promineifilaceae bacterium]
MITTGLKSNVSSTTFAVSGIAQGSSTYSAAANHDPDGDSSGTSITIVQP